MLVKKLLGNILFSLKEYNFLSSRYALHLPVHSRSVGGPATFMRNLAKELETVNYSFTRNKFARYQSILFPIQYEISYLKQLKKKGVTLIQRLDGVYYESHFGASANELNKNIKYIFNELADVVIFQSKYSELQCREVIGETQAKKTITIYNGADTSIFYPDKNPKTKPEKWRFICTANFRTIDMIEPIIKALDVLWTEKRNFEFYCIGPVADEKLSTYFERPYLKHFPETPLEKLPGELRSAHIYLFSYLNPNCPNSVIEAISCGLPVVSFSSGSLPELCSHQKELLANVSKEVIQSYDSFHSEKLYESLKKCMEEYSVWRNKALLASQSYSAKDMTRQYLQAIQECQP